MLKLYTGGFRMERTRCGISTVCYLTENDKTLFLKFNKKWGQVFAPPGGKIEDAESPLECIIREYKEETGLTLKNPKLKGYSYWNWLDEEFGIIFIYTASEYDGVIKEGIEGNLSWIKKEKISNLKQFDMNCKFNDLLFQEGMFEGNFQLDKDHRVESYKLTKI